MDKLQKYLTQNADVLGDDMPSPKVWMGISNSLKKEINNPIKLKKRSSKIVLIIAKYAVAACIMALAGFGGWVLLISKNESKEPINVAKQQRILIDTEHTVPTSADTPLTVIENVASKIITAFGDNKKINANSKSFKCKEESVISGTGFIQVKNVDSQFQQIINVQKNKINNTPLFAEKPTYFKDFVVSFKQMEKDENNLKKDIVILGFTDELLDQLINVHQQKLNLLKLLQTEINKTNIRFKQNRYLIDTVKAYFIKI